MACVPESRLWVVRHSNPSESWNGEHVDAAVGIGLKPSPATVYIAKTALEDNSTEARQGAIHRMATSVLGADGNSAASVPPVWNVPSCSLLVPLFVGYVVYRDCIQFVLNSVNLPTSAS